MDGYAFPVYVTDFCPRNRTEWRERSLSLNCTKTNGYTCIPNEDFTKLLQFCYTDLRIRIQKGNKKVNGRNTCIINGLCKRYFLNKKYVLKRSFKITVNFMHWLILGALCNWINYIYTFFFFTPISGMCLFLYRHNSLVDAMSCRTFMKGCPHVSYFSDEIFKCKNKKNVHFLLFIITKLRLVKNMYLDNIF